MNPEDHAKEFLTEHMNSPEIFRKYIAWCEETKKHPVKFTVFFRILFNFFGSI